MKKKFLANSFIILSIILGIITGYLDFQPLVSITEGIAEISIKLMKFLAVPLLFLSVVSSAAHFKNGEDVKKLGLKIVKYTLLTTFIAALIAEGIFWLSSPYILGDKILPAHNAVDSIENQHGFFAAFMNMIPDNLILAFLENNILAIVVLAVVLALALLSIKSHEKEIIFSFFTGLLSAVMRIVHVLIKFLPISVWAFMSILTRQVLSTDDPNSLNAIWGLVLTVISANLVQGLIVLPIFLMIKKVRAWQLFMQVKEALVLAFFSRSSAAALPLTLECATKNARISHSVAQLSLPLCTTINMNGCAQFILLSTYFVSYYTGHPMDGMQHIAMIFLSVMAAIGNAGVPMGCFFLASSIIAANNIPLYLMGSILPLYTFIDMVETSLNVWSDVCVTKVIDKENHNEA